MVAMRDQLITACGEAERDNKTPKAWRFSPEGWDKVRADLNALHYIYAPRGPIESVLGLPFSIDTRLPAETDFELDSAP